MNTMIRTSAVVAAALAGVAFAAAAPASADTPSGSYTRTNTGLAGGGFEIVLTPCGSGCIHWERPGYPESACDLHLQGNRWAGVKGTGDPLSFDNDSLMGTDTMTLPDGRPMVLEFQLSKNG